MTDRLFNQDVGSPGQGNPCRFKVKGRGIGDHNSLWPLSDRLLQRTKDTIRQVRTGRFQGPFPRGESVDPGNPQFPEMSEVTLP